jgi:hypothetical protein
MKKSHKTIALAIIIAIALGILAMFIPKAASSSTADANKLIDKVQQMSSRTVSRERS